MYRDQFQPESFNQTKVERKNEFASFWIFWFFIAAFKASFNVKWLDWFQCSTCRAEVSHSSSWRLSILSMIYNPKMHPRFLHKTFRLQSHSTWNMGRSLSDTHDSPSENWKRKFRKLLSMYIISGQNRVYETMRMNLWSEHLVDEQS